MSKRRGNGEGSIFPIKDKDGKIIRYAAAVSLDTGSGKPKRKVLYGKTRKEAAEKLKIALRDQQLGVNIAAERQTVQQFLDKWLETVVKPRNRIRTYESYQHTVKKYLIPHLGTIQLHKLTPENIQVMVNTLQESGLTRTVEYVRAVLVIALNVAVKWQYIPRNVAAFIDAPKVDKRHIAPLTPEQAKKLLEAVKGDRLEVLYRLALSLGLRRGEVLALRWGEDVELAAGTIRIANQLQRIKGELVFVPPKTPASVRILPLSPVLIDMLREHKRRQDSERTHKQWQEHDLLFPSTHGTPLDPRNLLRLFKAALEAAQLPATTRFHDLRHSMATFLLAQGESLKVIGKLLGHTQISTTADIYAHVLPELEHAAILRMDKLLG